MSCTTITTTATMFDPSTSNRKRKCYDVESHESSIISFSSHKRPKPTLAQPCYPPPAQDESMQLDRPVGRDILPTAATLAAGAPTPHELVERTFTHLPGHDLLRTQLACRDFQRVVCSSGPLRREGRHPRFGRSPATTTSPSPSSYSPAAAAAAVTTNPPPNGGSPQVCLDFLHIAPTGRHGVLALDRIPSADSAWRHALAFPTRPRTCSALLRIPGRFGSHPIVSVPAPHALMPAPLTLGALVDGFLQCAPLHFWVGRKAEFFALEVEALASSPQPPPQPQQQQHQGYVWPWPALAKEVCPSSCARDAMEWEMGSSGRASVPEMMCLN